jgi:aldehyde dehydrogenase (NAD+)
MLAVTDQGVTAMNKVVDELRQHFNDDVTRTFAFRQKQLQGIANFLKENEAEIMRALAADLGKPPLECLLAEIAVVKGELDYAQRHLASWMRPRKVSTLWAAQPAHSYVQAEPLGVVLIISAWNYPVQLALAPLIGAIAAGNAAVLKPSENAPAVSRLLAELLPKYLDARCVSVVEGGVPETSELLAQPLDHIFFTGSGEVGKIVMQAAAKNLTPVTLELGGKNPCIVDKNTDIATAAERIVWGKFSNAGQTCIAPDYVLVHEEVEEELLQQMQLKLRAFYGDNPEQSLDYGRVVNQKHHQRLMSYMTGSGDVFTGGTGNENTRYIAPTILRNVAKDAPIMDKTLEIFGPVLPVVKVASVHEAVQYLHGRPKSLTLYLFSADSRMENYVREHTSSGSLVVNHCLMQGGVTTLPFGGVGASGMGAYHGKASFDTFSHQKSVFVKPGSSWIDPSKLLYPPRTELKERVLRFALGV